MVGCWLLWGCWFKFYFVDWAAIQICLDCHTDMPGLPYRYTDMPGLPYRFYGQFYGLFWTILFCCLIFKDGFYKEESINQASSSSGSRARRLFDEYILSVFTVENDCVPGLAFKNNSPFMELKELDLQRLASVESQLQFYQSAIFMGCMTGEIELGMSNDTQVNLQMEMMNWFPENLSQQAPPRELQHLIDHKRPSSSSSSLRSLSLDSSEVSPFRLNIPSPSYLSEPPTEAPTEQTLRQLSTSISPLHQALQALSQIRNPLFPTPETEEDAIRKAFLSVISSSPSSSSSSLQSQQNIPPNFQVSEKASSAFNRYRSVLGPSTSMTTSSRRQSIAKRAITFFRSLGLTRAQEREQGSRPTSSQLHHMISERKRREKLNEMFQALRSLLPPGTKKDKASLLTSTTALLTSLKDQVAELTRRNQLLEAQLLPRKESSEEVTVLSSNERVRVEVTHVAELTLEEAQIIDLEVIVRGECNVLDLVMRTLEFLKQVNNVNLMSVEADTRLVESTSLNRVTLRLKIEGGEWDQSAFQEAVKRIHGG
ncbi:putative transcription factor bHLH041 [Camellia lanceoleosa]|uniref:Transcription factor bHLH041 n=1 Tax=Camellia lanceoleosa TaxID=1840588 RepID=A0ACC0IC07_9ERIC|nr:putative transcription factor bHLH041 [Camellia lanceoleosa]